MAIRLRRGQNRIRRGLSLGIGFAAAVSLLAAMLFGLEGVNEPERRNGDWVQRTPEEQQKLYETVKGDAALAHIFRWWFPPSPTCVTVRGSLATSAGFSDFGDMHPYAARNQPSRHWGWGLSMERAIAEARKVSGTKPILCRIICHSNRAAEALA